MRILALLALALSSVSLLRGQTIAPDVTSWILNRDNGTGYNGIPTNVQRVQYSADNVYVSCTGIPSYDIGPWPGNPNQAKNGNFVFKITRSPQENTGAPVATPLGHIGIWTNGVSIFNARDARSYNNANIWHQNAVLVEWSTFDNCLGHPAPGGEYHHHLNPTCLYDDSDSSRHSPIIGYAFDGFPVYGAYGFRSADGSGGITRMRSSYRLRSIEGRTTLPDGTQLQPAQHGPAISAQYPLGYYTEDFEYIPGSGDLDEHNGRFSITPEYPNGTYAYFVTLDASGNAAYPYTLGPTYKGIVPPGNTGPNSGHNVPSEPVLTYTPSGVALDISAGPMMIYPNPASEYVALYAPLNNNRWHASLLNMNGTEVMALGEIEGGGEALFPLSALAEGAYILVLNSTAGNHVTKLVVTR